MPVKQFYQRKGLCAVISAVPEVQEVFHNTTQARDRNALPAHPPAFEAEQSGSPLSLFCRSTVLQMPGPCAPVPWHRR